MVNHQRQKRVRKVRDYHNRRVMQIEGGDFDYGYGFNDGMMEMINGVGVEEVGQFSANNNINGVVISNGNDGVFESTRTSELTIAFEGEVYVFPAVTPSKVSFVMLNLSFSVSLYMFSFYGCLCWLIDSDWFFDCLTCFLCGFFYTLKWVMIFLGYVSWCSNLFSGRKRGKQGKEGLNFWVFLGVFLCSLRKWIKRENWRIVSLGVVVDFCPGKLVYGSVGISVLMF